LRFAERLVPFGHGLSFFGGFEKLTRDGLALVLEAANAASVFANLLNSMLKISDEKFVKWMNRDGFKVL